MLQTPINQFWCVQRETGQIDNNKGKVQVQNSVVKRNLNHSMCVMFLWLRARIQIYSVRNIQNNNIASCAIWMWNMVSYIKGGMQAEEDLKTGSWGVYLDPRGDENGEWRRLNNEKLHSLYHSPNIVRVIKSRWLRRGSHVARIKEGRSAFKILAGKPTGERSLGRPRCTWEDNIRMK